MLSISKLVSAATSALRCLQQRLTDLIAGFRVSPVLRHSFPFVPQFVELLEPRYQVTPTITFEPLQYLGLGYSISLVTDPVMQDGDNNYDYWTVYWGDNTPSDTVNGASANFFHIYDDPNGSYTIQAGFDGDDADNVLTVSGNGYSPSFAIFNANAVLPAGGDEVLEVSSLSLNGTLDLNDNILLYDSTSAGRDAALSGINSLIQSGKIKSSWVDADSSDRTLDATINSNNNGTPIYDSIDGHSVDANTIIVRPHANNALTPSLYIQGNDQVYQDGVYALYLSSSLHGQSLSSDQTQINWGDNTTDTLSGNPSVAYHRYLANPGNYAVHAVGLNSGTPVFQSNIKSVAVVTSPPAQTPLAFGASAASSSEIDLQWYDQGPFSGYELQRSNGGAWATIATFSPEDGFFADQSGLSQNTTYDYRIRATGAGGDSDYATASATTLKTPPTIAVGGRASAAPNPVTATTTNLSVTGTDGQGGSDLTYLWTVIDQPDGAQPPDISPNNASTATATFHQSGDYTFEATISNDQGGSITSDVDVQVNQTRTTAIIDPSSVTLARGAQQAFTFSITDQFGFTMPSYQDDIGWTIDSGGVGTILHGNPTATYTATDAGSATVRADDHGLIATASVNVDTAGIFKVKILSENFPEGELEEGEGAAIDDSLTWTGDLSVTNSDWIAATSLQDAVSQAIGGTLHISGSHTGNAVFPDPSFFKISDNDFSQIPPFDPFTFGTDGNFHGHVYFDTEALLSAEFRDWDAEIWTIEVDVPTGVNISVDSNNDSGLAPDPHVVNNAEDSIEDDASKPGKLIAVNDGDLNSNSVPDYADLAPTGDDQFVPLSLALTTFVDPSKVSINFSYSSSDPAHVQRYGAGTSDSPYTYVPAGGNLRIWTRDGVFDRNPAAVDAGGDFVDPGTASAPKYYTADELGLSDAHRTVTLYVEAVRPSYSTGDQRIVASLKDIASGDNLGSDALRLSSYDGLIRVDANRDGMVSFNSSDATSPSKPYRFWLNDNADHVDPAGNTDNNGVMDYDQLNPIGAPALDYQTGIINNARDLQDFARFSIQPPPGYDYWSFDWQVRLKFTATDSTPSIYVFNVSPTEAFGYLTNSTIADQLGASQRHYLTHLTPGTDIDLANIYNFGANNNGPADFIFEGATSGSAKVTVSFVKGSTEVATDSFDLQLQPAHLMYETYSIGNSWTSNDWGGSLASIASASTPLVWPQAAYTANSPESNDYILFVHGWRMQGFDKQIFADTAFKRLFWQGYKGKFGAFDWPTEYVDTNSTFRAASDPQNYDRSEQKAWLSATPLKNLLVTLDGKYGYQHVDMFAHSMGNIVASEALRLAGNTKVVHAYVATQAATVAEAYDANTNDAPTNLFTGHLALNGPSDAEKARSIYADFPPTPGKAYFADIGNAADQLINFYNPQDYALFDAIHTLSSPLTWRLNQSLKPDAEDPNHGHQYWYDWSASTNSFERISDNGVLAHLNLSDPSQRYEAFSFAAEPRSMALGAQENMHGPFTGEVNLRTAFGALWTDGTGGQSFTNVQWDHSAQFNGTNANRWMYWDSLLNHFSITKGSQSR